MRSPALLLALALAGPAAAQLVPALPRVTVPIAPLLRQVTDVPQTALRRLDAVRLDRVARLVRDHPAAIALDPDGFPARAHELVVGDPDDALIAAATAQGFAVIERDTALGVGFARLRTPAGQSFKSAIRTLRRLGAREVEADQLHFPSGAVRSRSTSAPVTPPGDGPFIGMIDGGVGEGVLQRGFATGAPRASDHGAAIASLIVGRGPVRGAAPDARLAVADV